MQINNYQLTVTSVVYEGFPGPFHCDVLQKHGKKHKGKALKNGHSKSHVDVLHCAREFVWNECVQLEGQKSSRVKPSSH
jgi:hypothetical protein